MPSSRAEAATARERDAGGQLVLPRLLAKSELAVSKVKPLPLHEMSRLHYGLQMQDTEAFHSATLS